MAYKKRIECCKKGITAAVISIEILEPGLDKRHYGYSFNVQYFGAFENQPKNDTEFANSASWESFCHSEK